MAENFDSMGLSKGENTSQAKKIEKTAYIASSTSPRSPLVNKDNLSKSSLQDEELSRLLSSPSLSGPKISISEFITSLQSALSSYKQANFEAQQALHLVAKKFSKALEKSLNSSIGGKEKEGNISFFEGRSTLEELYFSTANSLLNQFFTVSERFFSEREKEVLFAFTSLPESLFANLQTVVHIAAYARAGSLEKGQVEIAQMIVEQLFPKNTLLFVAAFWGMEIPLKTSLSFEAVFLSILSKAALFAAATPGIAALSTVLGKRDLSSETFEKALATGFFLAIRQVVEDETLENIVAKIVEQDFESTNFSQKEKERFTTCVSQVLNLHLLRVAFETGSFAIQLPNLSSVLLTEAFSSVCASFNRDPLSLFLKDSQALLPLLNRLSQMIEALGLKNQEEEIFTQIEISLGELKNIQGIRSSKDLVCAVAALLERGGISSTQSNVLSVLFLGELLGGAYQMDVLRRPAEAVLPCFTGVSAEAIVEALAPLFGQLSQSPVNVYHLFEALKIEQSQFDDVAMEMQGLSQKGLTRALKEVLQEIEEKTSLSLLGKRLSQGEGMQLPTAQLLEKQLLSSCQQQGISLDGSIVIVKTLFALSEVLPESLSAHAVISLHLVQTSFLNEMEKFGVGQKAINHFFGKLFQKEIVPTAKDMQKIRNSLQSVCAEIRILLEEKLREGLEIHKITKKESELIAKDAVKGFFSNTEEGFSEQSSVKCLQDLLLRFSALSKQAAEDAAKFTLESKVYGRKESLKSLMKKQELERAIERFFIERSFIENGKELAKEASFLMRSIRIFEERKNHLPLLGSVEASIFLFLMKAGPLPFAIAAKAVELVEEKDLLVFSNLSKVKEKIGLKPEVEPLIERAFKLSLCTPEFLETEEAFMQGFIKRLCVELPEEKQKIQEIVSSLSFEEIFNRPKLKEKIKEGLQKTGLKGKVVEAYAQFIARGVIRSKDMVLEDSLKHHVQGLLTLTGIPFDSIVELTQKQKWVSFVDVDDGGLESGVKVKRGLLKEEFTTLLQRSGYLLGEASFLASSLALLFLNFNDQEYLAQEIAKQASCGLWQMREKIVSELQVLQGGNRFFSKELILQVSLEACRAQSSAKSIKNFRKNLSEGLHAAIANLEKSESEAIASRLSITPSIRQEILKQQIMRLGGK